MIENPKKQAAEQVAGMLVNVLETATLEALQVVPMTDGDGMRCYDVVTVQGDWLAQVGWDDLEWKWVVCS